MGTNAGTGIRRARTSTVLVLYAKYQDSSSTVLVLYAKYQDSSSTVLVLYAKYQDSSSAGVNIEPVLYWHCISTTTNTELG